MIEITFAELCLTSGYFSGVCIPIIVLKKDKGILPNLSYLIEEKKDTTYVLDFRYDLFDSMSKETIKFFEEEIFIHSSKNCFDKKSWKTFDHYYRFLPRNININTNNNKQNLKGTKKLIKEIKKNNTITQPIIKYISKEELKKIFSKDTYNIKDYEIKDYGYIIPERKIKIKVRENDEKNERYILLCLLYAIFNSYFDFKILKCQNCDKFFFAQKSDTLYCDRIYKEHKTCKNFIKCENLRNGKGLFPELSKRIYETQKKKGLSTQFLEKEKNMLKMYPNNKEKQIEFYLSFYTNTTNGKKAKQKTICDFNLTSYIQK